MMFLISEQAWLIIHQPECLQFPHPDCSTCFYGLYYTIKITGYYKITLVCWLSFPFLPLP
jgi:hypothetical protein